MTAAGTHGWAHVEPRASPSCRHQLSPARSPSWPRAAEPEEDLLLLNMTGGQLPRPPAPTVSTLIGRVSCWGTQAFTPGRLRAHWPCCHLTGDPSWAWNGLDGRGLSVVASWVLVLTRPALPGLLGGDPSATRTRGGQGHGNEQHTFPVCAGPPSHPAPQAHWLCSTWGRCGLEDHAGTCQRRGRGWGSRDSGHPPSGATPSAGDPEALASPVVGGTHASI